jgi:hypothetical protein
MPPCPLRRSGAGWRSRRAHPTLYRCCCLAQVTTPELHALEPFAEPQPRRIGCSAGAAPDFVDVAAQQFYSGDSGRASRAFRDSRPRPRQLILDRRPAIRTRRDRRHPGPCRCRTACAQFQSARLQLKGCLTGVLENHRPAYYRVAPHDRRLCNELEVVAVSKPGEHVCDWLATGGSRALYLRGTAGCFSAHGTDRCSRPANCCG